MLVAIALSLAAGLVSFLSPCVLPLLPGYLAYVSGVAGSTTGPDASETTSRTNRRRMVVGSLLFVLGFAAVFLVIIVLAGSVGAWLWEWQDAILRVMGAVVILMGIVFMGAFGSLQRTKKLHVKPKVGLVGAPVLGIVFAVGWAPCMGPTLGAVIALSMQAGSAGRASILAVSYCLGLGIPFVLAAFGFGWMTQTMTFFKRHIRAVNLIGGGLLILIGLLMVSGIWSLIMFELQAVIGGYVTPL